MLDNETMADARYRALAGDPAYTAYMSKHGIVGKDIYDQCSPMFAAMVEDIGNGRFALSDGKCAVPGMVITAYDTRNIAIDQVAWPMSSPSTVMTKEGRCSILGIARAFNVGTYAFGRPIAVHRTPLAWLQGGCKGAVIVNHSAAAPLLYQLPGNFLAEDDDHGLEIIRIGQSLFDPSRVVVPSLTRSEIEEYAA